MNNIDSSYFDNGKVSSAALLYLLFNVSASLCFLLLALPAFILIPIAIKMQDGGPVFYVGSRLGKAKKRFNIYKFRTLEVGAEQLLGAQLLSPHHKLETPIGKFLRDSRLDELPQLFNVLRGEMVLIGPRPERPSVYLDVCRKIPGYDKRFTVKPGLIGYAQLFTPHSTPKTVRVLIDNNYLLRKKRLRSDILLFGYAIAILSANLLVKIFASLAQGGLRQFKSGARKERRNTSRIGLKATYVTIWHDGKQRSMPQLQGIVININDNQILIATALQLSLEKMHIELVTTYRPVLMLKTRHKCMHCDVILTINKGFNPQTELFESVLMFDCISPLNTLKLNKYFLNKSIA